MRTLVKRIELLANVAIIIVAVLLAVVLVKHLVVNKNGQPETFTNERTRNGENRGSSNRVQVGDIRRDGRRAFHLPLRHSSAVWQPGL